MDDTGLPIQRTGSWTFHLQQGQTLQFHIAAEQGGSDPLRIDGHDISVLLDYLYEHRELIYDATHDQERRRLEALEAAKDSLLGDASRRAGQPVQPILYFDDGRQRTRAQLEGLSAQEKYSS